MKSLQRLASSLTLHHRKNKRFAYNQSIDILLHALDISIFQHIEMCELSTHGFTGSLISAGVLVDMNLNGIASYPIADALAARDVPYFFSNCQQRHQHQGRLP